VVGSYPAGVTEGACQRGDRSGRLRGGSCPAWD